MFAAREKPLEPRHCRVHHGLMASGQADAVEVILVQAQAPGAQAPGAQAPGAQAPDGQAPGSLAPGSLTPDGLALGSLAPDGLGRLLGPLTADEACRARRFVFDRDRWQFVIGRLLLRHALKTRFGIAQAPLHLTPYGRPQLEAAQRGIDFNLSHTHGLVVCALARGCAVGIDVERADRRIDAKAIAEAYFAPSERARCADAPGHGRAVFLQLWTLKEAVAKAAGWGLSLPLDCFAVGLDPARLEYGPAEISPPALWQLQAWHLPQAVQLALAVRRPDTHPRPIHFSTIDPNDLMAQALQDSAVG